MKRALFLALAFMCPTVIFAATGSVRTVARSVGELSRIRDNRLGGSAFDLECTVIFHVNEARGDVIIIDGSNVCSVLNHSPFSSKALRFGDRIHISGLIAVGGPQSRVSDLAICTDLAILARNQMPQIEDVTASELLHRIPNDRPVRLRGTLIDADMEDIRSRWAILILDCDGDKIHIAVERHDDKPFDFRPLFGATVSVIGHHSDGSGNLRQTVKNLVVIDSVDMITVLNPPPGNDLFAAEDVERFKFLLKDELRTGGRRRAIGCVLAAWGGKDVLIRTDSGKLVKGELSDQDPPSAGERIRLVGFPETDLYIPILIRAMWKHEPGPILPNEDIASISPLALRDVTSTRQQFNFIYNGRTIRMTGMVRGLPIKNGDGLLYVESDGQIVAVDISSASNAIKDISVGFGVEVTGVCIIDTEKMTFNRVFPRINGYRIVIRTTDDIRVVSRPPWWTPMRLLIIIGALLIALGGIFIWNRSLVRVADRRSRELLKEQLARIESDLKVGERTRLSVELHDTLSQNLLGASMEINTAEQLVSEADALRHLGIASKTLRASRDELRNCLWDLRSQALEEPDMNAAIRKTLEPYVSDVDLQVRFNVPREIFTDNTAHALMRIIRELVLNAIRHGRAKTVKIAGSRENGQLLFSVHDDGCGFEPSAVPGIGQGHFGLQGVRERLRLLKGSVSVESSPGMGTYVSARFRLPTNETEKI